MPIKYIDFDGVIYDTESLLFNEKYYEAKKQPGFTKDKYIQELDWYNTILKSKEINDSIKILREMKDAIILTKVNSLYNEAKAKISILRDAGIENNIILVPFIFKKTDIVNPKGNILVDDTLHNLEDWELGEGIPIFFNKDGNNIDGWNRKNTKYKMIKTLEYIKNYR